MNINPHSFKSHLKRHKFRVLFRNHHGENFTYSDLHRLGTQSLFFKTRQNLVFCLAENDILGLAGYLALLVANAVPMMLGANISPQSLQNLIDLYKPKFIWLPEWKMQKISISKCIMVLGEYRLLELTNLQLDIHDSLALLISTSGSTGSPKFVKLSRENIYYNAESIANFLNLSSDEIPITTLPPSYAYGLSILHSHILVGATIAVTKLSFFDREFWEFFRLTNVTSMGGVPYHYEMLKKLHFIKLNIPSLRTLTQAGGRMDPNLTKEFAAYCSSTGKRFFTMYGQAEATARMSYLPCEKSVRKAGSIGTAIPGGKFWLESEQRAIIDQAEVTGELIYQGPNVSLGYASCPEDLAKGDERHGVLRTGDLAKRDVDGDYYIVGRINRFIKIFGNRINLEDVENLLHFAGHLAACAGMDDCLEIYLVENPDCRAHSIKKMIVEYLHISPVGVKIYSVPDLPRTESGKIHYAELQPQMGTMYT